MNPSTFLIFPLLICTASEVNYAPSSTARLFSLPFGNVLLLQGGDTQWKGKWLVSGWARSQEVSPHVLHHRPSEPCTCSSHPKVLWMAAWLTLRECSGTVSGPGVTLFSPAVPFMPQNEVWKEILNGNTPPSLPVHPSFFTSSPQALSLAQFRLPNIIARCELFLKWVPTGFAWIFPFLQIPIGRKSLSLKYYFRVLSWRLGHLSPQAPH